MSDLSQLIEINKNIEKQNREIIRLLKVIAGENQGIEEVEEEIPEQKLLIEDSLGVGEVYFVDDGNLFKLSIKNNEKIIDNLTGDGECSDFNAALLAASQSIDKNQSFGESLCILNQSSKGKLPETLKVVVENGGKQVFIPWNQMTELVTAPQELQLILKLNFYKNDEDLIERLFK